MRLQPLRTVSPARRLGALVLAALLALQGVAAGVLAVLGPLHVHAGQAAHAVLDDFRRTPASFSAAEPHAHVDDAAGRHHHADGLDVVVLDDARDRLGDEPGASTALAAFVALLGSDAVVGSASAVGQRVAHRPWSCLTHTGAMPERPPRAS